MDIQNYQQVNLREIQESLSKIIIKTKTLLDNPIPKHMNNIDLQANVDNDKLELYRDA